MSCLICKCYEVDPHHLMSRGSIRDKDIFNVKENVIELCRKHHTEIHQIGRETFLKKYNKLEVLTIAKEKVRELEKVKNKRW